MSPTRSTFITRDDLVKMLSDAELARVSLIEDGARLTDGEEYIDLGQLDGGVQIAHATVPIIGRALPRNAVAERTWHRLTARLAELRGDAPVAPGTDATG